MKLKISRFHTTQCLKKALVESLSWSIDKKTPVRVNVVAMKDWFPWFHVIATPSSSETFIKRCNIKTYMSHLMTKPTKWLCAQWRLRSALASAQSESSLCAQWVAKEPNFLHVDSEDSDQSGWMPRLIWVFAGRTIILFVLSWGGSFRKS